MNQSENKAAPWRALINLIEAAEDLQAACDKMIEVTGGSQYWNGETHDALVMIEKALAKSRGTP